MAGAAFRSFAGTFAIGMVGGIVLAGISWSLIRPQSTGYALLAAGLAMVEAIAAATFLAGQRAVLSATARGLETFHLGGSVIRLIFDRINGPAVTEGENPSGGRIAQGLERLPLARAEELLNGGVRSVLGDPAAGGGLRRMIHSRLVTLIGKYTLSRFRAADAEHGGIEVPKLRDELERTVDSALARKVRASRLVPTLLVAVGLPLVVAAQTWLIRTQAAGIPSAALRVLENADRFELISLDPNIVDPKTIAADFHGFYVLGRTEIQDPRLRRKLIDALQDSVEIDGLGANCFCPRHAIRAVWGDESIDLGICFQCSWLYVYDELEKHIVIYSMSQPIFDDVLRRAGVPLPPAGEIMPCAR